MGINIRRQIAHELAAICLLAGFTTLQASATDQPIRTTAGLVSGVASSDGRVVSFKGIPYAAPPVGTLRWREPQPVEPWSGVRMADHFSNNCVQALVRELLPWTHEFMLGNDVSEDCLYLNIWVPAKTPGVKLPVYAYIHGGAFTGGSGDVSMYDGDHLARRGLIVITLNYRLGILGFFAHPDLTAESPHHSSGNYGLLDQLAALQWISQNIAKFGGDPQRVTVGGQSAGAMSVSFLVASPVAKSVFSGAVAESGSGVIIIPMHTLQQAEEAGENFAEANGAPTLQDLRKMPYPELTRAVPGGGRGFGPIVDGWFLPIQPAEAFTQGKQNDVPTMTGWNANDSLGKPTDPASYRKQAEERYGSFAEEFLRLYPAEIGQQVLASYTEASRDRNRVSVYLWARTRARTAKTPAFLYFFTRAIPWPEHPEFGAFHTGEVPYIFDNLDRLNRPWQPADRETARILSSYLINFVQTGNPNGVGIPVWPAFHPETRIVIEVGNKAGPIPLAPKEKEQFWIRYLNSPASRNAPFL